MAGFDNDVVYGTNVDFTGTSPVSGQINLDGELLIGAAVAPFIRAGFLTGSGGITITNGPGTVNIDGGSGASTTYRTDAGNAIPAAGLLFIVGGTGISTSGSGNTVTITNTQSLAGFVPYVGATTDVVLGTNDLSAENLSVTNGNLNMPAAGTWVVGTTGFINLNSQRWIYEYGAFGNTALGLGAGNPAATTSDSNVAVGDGNMAGHGNGALRNTAVGAFSQQSLAGGTDNTSLGQLTLTANQNGIQNIAIGSYAMQGINGGTGNTVVGYNSLGGGGSYNTVIGFSSGLAYTNGNNESNNVLLCHPGIALDQNIMRLGQTGSGTRNVNQAYIAAVVGTTTSNSLMVTINSVTEQLGAATIPTGTVTSVSGTAFQVAVATGTTTPVISLIGPYTPATYTAHGVLIGEGTSSIAATAAGTNGQVLVGSTGADPVFATLGAGTAISYTTGAGTLTISVSGGGVTWTDVSGTSQAAAVNNGYVANNAGLVTITLPANFAVGDVVRVAGLNTGLWKLAANTGDIINFGSSPTTAGGSLTATNRYDCVEVVGVTANTTWVVLSSVGNLTVA